LVVAGNAVRDQTDMLADAQAVAAETMQRVRENIQLLIQRLKTLGFEFAYQPKAAKREESWYGDSYPVYETAAERTREVNSIRPRRHLGRFPCPSEHGGRSSAA
jgi:hypothetical protein